MNRWTTMLATALTATALLTGCSGTVLNKGGDTTCQDFTAADEKTQKGKPAQRALRQAANNS